MLATLLGEVQDSWHLQACNGDTMLRRVRNCRFIIIIIIIIIIITVLEGIMEGLRHQGRPRRYTTLKSGLAANTFS